MLEDDTPPRPERPRANCPEYKRLKPEIVAAIREHLAAHGPHNWNLVRERPEFSHVVGRQAGETGKKRFDRWKEKVMLGPSSSKTRPHECADAASANMAAAKEAAAKRAAANLPATPAEAFHLRYGAGVDQRFDYAQRLAANAQTLDAMRAQLCVADPTAPNGMSVTDIPTTLAILDQDRKLTLAAAALEPQIVAAEEHRRTMQTLVTTVLTAAGRHPEAQDDIVQALQQAFSNAAPTIPEAQS